MNLGMPKFSRAKTIEVLLWLAALGVLIENVSLFRQNRSLREAVATLQSGAGGDTLTGPFTFQLTNLQGTVVLAASGTFSATRILIQPLATP